MTTLNNTIRVLIIDDDEDDYLITGDYLRNIPGKKFSIDWCYNYKNALDVIKEERHDIYLIDYRLGAKTGIDLLKESMTMEFQVPFIILTGKGDIQIDQEAMKLGAFDYLIKGELNSEKLERSIRYSIDRAETLNKLRNNERKFRNIFIKSSDGLFVTDNNFHFTDANNSFLKLLNCTLEELVGLSLDGIFTDQFLSNKLVTILRDKGYVEETQADVQYNTEDIKICIFTASRERNLDGKFYYRGMFEDITLLKKAELDTMRAEKLAATGRLVRTLAHEVRNPINNINLAIEHLRIENKEKELDIYYDIIYRNSTRINELIKELLNSSKPAEIQIREVSVQSVLKDIIDSSKDRMNLKNIKLNVEYPQEPIMFACDYDKIILALLNIIINAVEAIDNNKGEINLGAKSSNNNVVIEINDNGVGISEDKLPRLFEPYYTSKRNGIGLGLASTLNIVQSHGGSIEVASKENTGTTFSVNLPLKSKLHEAVWQEKETF